MPELPEVETTRRAIEPVLAGATIKGLAVRHQGLRWPVTADLPGLLAGRRVAGVTRRAKYLLISIDQGAILVHLGMSGSIRILREPLPPPGPHDHLDLLLTNGRCLRYNDPRRFGAWLWIDGDPAQHPLLKHLGPEPPDADADTLFRRAHGRRSSIKAFIMDNANLVGVGNIYAAEALFRAGIHPRRAAGRLSRERWDRLLSAIREVMDEAIRAGGSTIRNFSSGEGKPGYFAQTLRVYGRAGQPCPSCGTRLREERIAGRSVVYCPACQR